MKENDQPKEESNSLGVNRSGFSDPTPALPEGEGVRFETNESFTANEANSIPTPAIPEREGARFEANKVSYW